MNDKPQSRRGVLWLVLGLAALASAVLIFWVLSRMGGSAPERSAGPPSAPLVEAVMPRSAGNDYEVVEEGFLRPVARVDVVPEVSGRIVEVNPKLVLGGRLAKGELLFRIDGTNMQAEFEQAQADLESAQANLAQARANYARQQELQAIGATSEAVLEQARAEFLSAQAAVSQARAAVNAAQEQLDDTRVTAPFDAVVQQENVSVGDYVAPGNAVATLYNAGPAEVAVGLMPRDVDGVRRAADVADGALGVSVRPTRASALAAPLDGEVFEIATSLDPDSRTVDVLVRVPDAFTRDTVGRVFADDYVAVALPAHSDVPLYAAPEGVLREQGHVWLIDAEQRLARVAARAVRREADRVVFSAERDVSGQRLVLTALTEETEGMRVRVAGEPGEASGNAQASGNGQDAPRKDSAAQGE